MFTSIPKAYAALNRQNLLSRIEGDGLIYLKSESLRNRIYTDTEVPFRQESNFFYLTGCIHPDFHFTLDLKTKKSTIFIPEYDKDYALWHGHAPTVESVSKEYDVACSTIKDLDQHLAKYSMIHTLDSTVLNKNTNSCVLKQYL